MTVYLHCLRCGKPKGRTNRYFCRKCRSCYSCVENIAIRCERNPTLRKLLISKLEESSEDSKAAYSTNG
jgi:hypothetical protein